MNINDELKYLNMNIIKQQRFFKTHPHLFFQNYDLSIYMDTTFEIQGKLDEFLLRILNPNSNIYLVKLKISMKLDDLLLKYLLFLAK